MIASTRRLALGMTLAGLLWSCSATPTDTEPANDALPRWRELLESVPEGEAYPAEEVTGALEAIVAALPPARWPVEAARVGGSLWTLERGGKGAVVCEYEEWRSDETVWLHLAPSLVRPQSWTIDPTQSLMALCVGANGSSPERWQLRELRSGEVWVDDLHSVTAPLWLPGGDLILCPGKGRIERMDYVTGERSEVWRLPEGWGVQALLASDRGDRLVVTAHDGASAVGLWRVNLEGGPATRIDGLDPRARPKALGAVGRLDLFLSRPPAGTAEVLAIDATRQGAPVETILSVPNDAEVALAGQFVVVGSRSLDPGEGFPSPRGRFEVTVHGLDGEPRGRLRYEGCHLTLSQWAGRHEVCVIGVDRFTSECFVDVLDPVAGSARRKVLQAPVVELTWQPEGAACAGWAEGESIDPSRPVLCGSFIQSEADPILTAWLLIGGGLRIETANRSLTTSSPDPGESRLWSRIIDELTRRRLRPRPDVLARLRERGEL